MMPGSNFIAHLGSVWNSWNRVSTVTGYDRYGQAGLFCWRPFASF